MKNGDRVRLSEKGLTYFPKWRGRVMADRQGTITEMPLGSDGLVRVMWDGLTLPGTWAQAFLEVVKDGESGQAAIESALILPIFFFVVIGIFDFGQFLYFNQTLTMRLEAGARYAAVHGCKSPIATVCDPAVNVAVTNTADGSGAPMLAHLSASDISASVSFHRSQDPTPTVPQPAWIANEEDRITLSVSDYPIDLLFFPKFHRKASASQPIEWYQCYRDCK